MNPTPPFDTPVVVILFNRPHRIHELIGVLRDVRPARILAIADGPRASHPTDSDACSQARAALDEIDWPCSIEREFAEANMGCDHRIISGLNWAFSRVDRAIVLEDDILPHPSFFAWAAAMLERFANDSTVGLISGRNPLGRWGSDQQGYIRAPYGSILGWAATASVWRRVQNCQPAQYFGQEVELFTQIGLDPIVRSHCEYTLALLHQGRLRAWDTQLFLKSILLGLYDIHSPVNLIRNTGFGREATHSINGDDFRGLLEASQAPLPHQLLHSPGTDHAFARAALLVDLLARCRNPTMAVRLARMIQRGTRMPFDEATRHHLTPFLNALESLRLLEHLAAQGMTSPTFDCLLGAMRNLAASSEPTP